jgi:recombinational DNA repair protein RecT
MARKTVIRRLMKYVPKSSKLKQAIEIDDAFHSGEPIVEAEVQEPEPSKKGAEAMKAALSRREQESEPTEVQ